MAAREIRFAITAAGEIGPLDSVSVRPEVGGLISKLTLDIGDKVKKGDVLFELDDKDLQTEKTSRQTEIAGAAEAHRPTLVQAVSGAGGYNSGTEVFIVANLADMIITGHVNQSDVTHVKVGQAVTVDIEAVSGLSLTGHVDRIAPLATIRNGVKGFSTRIRLKNAEDKVRPGMTANLTIPLTSASDVRTVPLAAVFNHKGGALRFPETRRRCFRAAGDPGWFGGL